MRVFVAGASGVIGKPLVRELVAGGHEVTGATRSKERAEPIRAAGAEVAICDALDAEALRDAVVAAQPEVVVNELTALPRRRGEGNYEANNRIRREGTTNLVAAAQAAGARRLVAQSIAFIYELAGGWVKEEDAPLMSPGDDPYGRTVAAIRDLERQVLAAQGLEGVVLRYGFFYGPGVSYSIDPFRIELVRRRLYPIVGAGTGTFSFIHVDAAAAATVAALGRGSPGVYNIVDDEPAPLREWLPVYAAAVGAKPPLRVPLWLARLLGGRAAATMAVELRGASNAKAKRELGWEPRYSSWRQGFRESL
jgi:nucleoside-diphosphate-sugar epimerase